MILIDINRDINYDINYNINREINCNINYDKATGKILIYLITLPCIIFLFFQSHDMSLRG